MAAELGVAKEDCFSNGVFYKKGRTYPVDSRNPWAQSHFTFDSRAVDKSLEKSEKEKSK